MKWIVYGVFIVLLGGALFLPESGSAQIRNLPLLLGIVCVFAALYLFRFFRYVFFMWKTQRRMEKKGLRLRKICINPLFSMLRGQYSMSFRDKNSDMNITFMIARYPHYFFPSVNLVEFYRRGGLVFPGGRNRSPHMMPGENKLVGKQKFLWGTLDDPNDTQILLFNKLPPKITDSVKRQELGNGDAICGSAVRLMDWNGLCQYLDTSDRF